MGMFSKNASKDEIKKVKEKENMDKFKDKINIDLYGDLGKKEIEQLMDIRSKQSSANIAFTGQFMKSPTNPSLIVAAFEQVLIEQNYMIIQQLSKLNDKLNKDGE